jgi:hypothetical protein
MTKDNGTGKKTKESGEDELWGGKVGAKGAVILMVYLAWLAIILTVAAVFLLGKVCEETTEAGYCSVWMVLLVIVLATLGGQIRCLKSMWWYVGNRELKKSWVPMYLLSPLVGSMLGLVFYLLVRGGILALGGEMETPSEVGLAGASALVGMFSDEASMKFKTLAQAIFSNAEKGKDSEPEKGAGK